MITSKDVFKHLAEVKYYYQVSIILSDELSAVRIRTTLKIEISSKDVIRHLAEV